MLAKTQFLAYKSYLWTSALMIDKYDYAKKVGANFTVLDLEDSVPIAKKDEARNNAITYLKHKHEHPYGLRINSIRTQFGINDLNALIDSMVRPKIIFLPKVESAEEIVIVNQLLSSGSKQFALCAIIESSRGLKAIHEIAKIGNNLQLLLYGSADFSAELGVRTDWEGFDLVRQQLVLAAAYGEIAAIDTANFAISDLKLLKMSCRSAKNLGFVGKVAIHPSQVSIINQEFSPTKKEVIQAKTILKNGKQTESSIFIVANKMHGPPMIKAAQRLLARMA